MTICRAGVVFVLTIFQLQAIGDAKTDETIEMKIFNHEFRASDSKMRAILKEANLTGHGFKVEIVTKKVLKPGGGYEYQEMHYYYKDVHCWKMQEVEKELERLLPGAIKKDMGERFDKEIEARHLTSMKTCRVGVEVHFKGAEGCLDNQNSVSKRRQKGGCGWCFICISVESKQHSLSPALKGSIIRKINVTDI